MFDDEKRLDTILKMMYHSIDKRIVYLFEKEKRMLIMNMDELYGIADRAVMEEELTAREIPNIDLYVDQIINLVADKNSQSSERYLDKQLTKTMINNYSKDGLITPVKGKKYTKEQIVQILSIYSLKNTLSMGEIKRLLDGAYAIDGFDGNDLAEIYDRYISIKNSNREYSKEILSELVKNNGLDVDDERELILTVGSLLSLSGFLRSIAQEIIDVKYPQNDEETEKEKVKKEKKKKKQDTEE